MISDLFRLSQFSNLGGPLSLQQKYVPGSFLTGKVRSTPAADNSVVAVVLNVKVRMEAQQSIPSLGLHDLLGICLCNDNLYTVI
jgi:hypothetical protein